MANYSLEFAQCDELNKLIQSPIFSFLYALKVYQVLLEMQKAKEHRKALVWTEVLEISHLFFANDSLLFAEVSIEITVELKKSFVDTKDCQAK